MLLWIYIHVQCIIQSHNMLFSHWPLNWLHSTLSVLVSIHWTLQFTTCRHWHTTPIKHASNVAMLPPPPAHPSPRAETTQAPQLNTWDLTHTHTHTCIRDIPYYTALNIIFYVCMLGIWYPCTHTPPSLIFKDCVEIPKLRTRYKLLRGTCNYISHDHSLNLNHFLYSAQAHEHTL